MLRYAKYTRYRAVLAGCMMAALLPLAHADGPPHMGMACHEHGPGMMGKWAHPMMGAHGGHGMMFPHNVAAHLLMQAERLGLNPDQEAQLRQLRDRYIRDNSASEKQLWAAREDLADALRLDNLDTASAEKLVTQINGMKGQLWRAYIEQLKQIKTILTPEQLKTLRGRHGHHEGDMEHGGAMDQNQDGAS